MKTIHLNGKSRINNLTLFYLTVSRKFQGYPCITTFTFEDSCDLEDRLEEYKERIARGDEVSIVGWGSTLHTPSEERCR